MGGSSLFLVSVVAYSVLPLLYALWRGPARYLLLYVHLAGVLTLGGLLGAVYVLPIRGDVSLLAGQVSYGGFMFATLVTVVVGRSVHVVRNIILLTLAVNVLVYAVFRISQAALATGVDVVSPFATSPAVFDQSARVVISGGLLIILELLLLLVVLELAKGRLSSWAMAPVYVLAFVAILLLDGVLFPTFVILPPHGLLDFITAGVEAKAVLAAAFAVPLAVFVVAYRPALTRFEAEPMRLRALVSVTGDQLLERLDRQQSELNAQRARLTRSTARAGRAAATTSGLLRSAVNTLLVTADPDLTITSVSAGGLRILGYDEGELVGRTLDSLHAPAVWREHAARVGVAESEVGDPVVVVGAHLLHGVRDWDFLTRDGGTRTVSYSLTRIVDGDVMIGYLGAGEDVTDRVRTEQAMSAALQREHQAVLRLQEVDQLKADLVSNVSHELRTPITSVAGYLELISDGQYGDVSGTQRQALDRISTNMGRLERLVDDLLTLGASEAGRLVLDLVDLDLREVVESLVDLMEELCRGREIELHVDVGDRSIPLRGDRAALERIVINLVTNAIKFTEGPGSVLVAVRPEPALGSQPPSGCLLVRDSGIGIDAEAQQSLFTRFYRAPEASALAIPGSGLGLSIVHSIVAAHGGTVTVDSAPGSGTTVTVRLPADPARPLP